MLQPPNNLIQACKRESQVRGILLFFTVIPKSDFEFDSLAQTCANFITRKTKKTKPFI